MPALELITAAVQEPVTLAEQKLHSRIDISDDDTLISAYISAARGTIEKITGRRFINSTWKYWLDGFPPFINSSINSNVSASIDISTSPVIIGKYRTNTIYIPIGPVSAISAIAYIDSDDNETVWSSDNYVVDTVSVPARIVKKSSVSYPTTTLRAANGVYITFIAGYGADETEVPEDIKSTIKLLAGHYYEHRESVSDITLKEMPQGIAAILAPYIMYEGDGI